MTNPPRTGRIQSVDALRGLVMIIMALDHVREFFHVGAMSFQPEDLTRTTVGLFFTRWVTHMCAPVFAFTAGLGAYLWCSRGRRRDQLSRFLWTRGLWLVLLDVLVIRFAMFFSLTSGPVILSVLWAFGWSMVVLGFLARLPLRVVGAVSLSIVLLQHWYAGIPAAAFGGAAWVWNVLCQPGVVRLDSAMVITAYPVLPWLAVIAAGFCFGPVTQIDRTRRQRLLLQWGIGLTIAFVLIRVLNGYGDPRPWSIQGTPATTLLSFLNTTKYPPSLSFLLMTLGPALLVWRSLDSVVFKAGNPLLVFGRVPLFYFVVHLYVIHALTFALALVRYGDVSFLWQPLPSLGGALDAYPAGYGYDLSVVYVVWLIVVALMYPACVWLGRLKETRASALLSYI
jgi:uncharacterized membrane protein